jgi:hypothetical protein
VIGYQAHTVAPPYTQPSAAAALPSTKMRSPTASARRTFRPIGRGRWSLANCGRGAARDVGLQQPLLARYCSPNSFSMTSGSMSISTDSAPEHHDVLEQLALARVVVGGVADRRQRHADDR